MKIHRIHPATIALSLAAAAVVIGADTTPKTAPKAAPAATDPAAKGPGGLPADIAATVNGDPIKTSEVEENFARAAASRGMPADAVPADQKPMILRMLLDDMINENLMNKACAGVKVDPATVDAEFAKILKARGTTEEEAKKELAQMGMTVEKVKVDIQKRMQQRQWVDEQIKGKAADATDAEAKGFYTKNPQHFEQPEQVRASHILFRVEPDASPDKVTATLKKAEGATERAKKEDFAKLAGELSEEPGAAERGGDLNFFPRKGAMVEPFAEAAFKLKKGDVTTEPVRTEFGYHVIKVTDKKAGGTQSFDEAKPQIIAFLSRERKRVAIDEVIANMRKNADVKLNIAEPAAPTAPVAPGGGASATTPPVSIPPAK
jgi:peptidyl-prolyl cis-trans isomerase C